MRKYTPKSDSNQEDATRVIYLLNYAGKAGTERYVSHLMAGARARGYKPILGYNIGGPLVETAARSGVPCAYVRMRHPFDLTAARALARECDARGAEVVHTHYLRENYIALLAKLLFRKKTRVVHTNHFVTPNKPVIRILNRVLTRACHRVVAVCEVGAKMLVANGVNPKLITVVHNAVEPDEYRPGSSYARDRANTRAAYGVGDDEIVFLCASRFAHDKGHRFFIEACARLFSTAANVRVLLAGDGPLKAEIEELAESLSLGADKVTFLGFVPDLKPLFYASDVYVNPSEHEASSYLIIEALASGLPVIATNKGGNAEIVNPQNACGALIEYGDVDGLFDAMNRFRHDADLRAKTCAGALETVKRAHNLQDMLDRTFALYK